MNMDICGNGATRANNFFSFSKQIGRFIPVTICTTTSLNDGGGDLKTKCLPTVLRTIPERYNAGAVR